ANRLQVIAEVPRGVEGRQARNLLGGPERPGDHGTFPRGEGEPEVEGLEGKEDVGKTAGPPMRPMPRPTPITARPSPRPAPSSALAFLAAAAMSAPLGWPP